MNKNNLGMESCLIDLTKQPMHIQANPNLSNPLSRSSCILILAAKLLPITKVICCYKRDFFGTSEGKRRNEFAEWYVEWRAEWHNYAKYDLRGK